jgi:glutamine synthetase
MVMELGEKSALEKIEAAKEHNIRFVQLQFTDIIGAVKSVTIPLHQLGESVEHGTWFDGSSVEGFTRIAESDQYLKPDMDTFAEIPWQPGHGTLGSGPLGSRGAARVICDVFTPNGEPFPGDPRWVLSRQIERATGSSATSGTPAPSSSSSSFRRNRTARSSRCRTIRPATSTSDRPGTEVRKDMVNALEAFGIRVEAAHHEVAPGQHEIDFEYADGLRTADNAVTFKFTLKAVASSTACTPPSCPSRSSASTARACTPTRAVYSIAEERNAFATRRTKYGLSDLARQYIAGTSPTPAA